MYVPMWVDDEELAARLAGDPAVLDTQQYYSQLDVVITGIGDWKSGSSSLCKIFPDTGAKLCFNKISLRMCISLVSREGKILHSPIERLGFGISTDQLQKSQKSDWCRWRGGKI